MLKEIRKAYEDYYSKYERHPDFISISRDSFESIVRESLNNSDQTFYGMKALVVSKQTSDFDIFEDNDLSQALSLYNQSRDKYKIFTVYRPQPFKINLVGINSSTTPVEPEQRLDKVEIGSEVIRVYERHLKMKEMGAKP